MAGVPGLEPRLTGPEPVGLPITPYPIEAHQVRQSSAAVRSSQSSVAEAVRSEPTARSVPQPLSTTRLVRVPMPSIDTETLSPATSGPMPAGVPVSSTSPGKMVITAVT
jgi:hypothetical protein